MINANQQSNVEILERIDAVIKELQWLRQAVIAPKLQTDATSRDIVEELAGSLGQGNWDEYDAHLDWERFAE